MNNSDYISIVALFISVAGFFLSHSLDSYLYGPCCRINVCAVNDGKGLQIQFENVGNRIMHIKNISYIVGTLPKKKRLGFVENLSSFFWKLPCETRAEARIKNVNLFANSKHNLLTITFDKQADLIRAWKIVKNLTVRVKYRGLIGIVVTKYISLEDQYETFYDAISDGKGGIRNLKAFSRD